MALNFALFSFGRRCAGGKFGGQDFYFDSSWTFWGKFYMLRMPVQLAPMEVVGLVGNWWDEINESTRWQDGIFYALCAAYALVSSVALVFFTL